MNVVHRSCANSQIRCRRNPTDLGILTERSRYNDNPMLKHGRDRSKGAVIETTVPSIARLGGVDSELHPLIVLSRNVIRRRVSREFNFRTRRYEAIPCGRVKLEGMET